MVGFDTIDALVVATHNKGKAREISDLLSPYIGKFYTAIDLNLPEPEETGLTFHENAILKARAGAENSGKVALADDSGLSVHALGGEPGIYSARWAEKPDGTGRDFDYAMERVNGSLGSAEDRSGSFVCVLALAWPDGHVETFDGRVDGQITWPAKGDKGFGYDPIFIPDGHEITFAEMEPADKHAISHRAKAFEKLLKAFSEKR